SHCQQNVRVRHDSLTVLRRTTEQAVVRSFTFRFSEVRAIQKVTPAFLKYCFLLMHIGAAKEMARVKPAHRIRSLPFCLALILVLFTRATSEADCMEDALDKVDGRILVMASGALYRVTNTKGVELTFWLPPAGVTICDQVTISGEIYYSISN